MSTDKPEVPFTDAEESDDRRRPSLFIDASDVRMALEAGFTNDEVAFMLDLGEPAPDAKVDGEYLERQGAEYVGEVTQTAHEGGVRPRRDLRPDRRPRPPDHAPCRGGGSWR